MISQSALHQFVESTSQLESIHIQSPLFDPVTYLTTLHKETDLSTFQQGIQLVKSKASGSSSAASASKKDLVITNYVQFLAAKLTLDDIN
jgi:hypothetical protein